VLFGTRDQRKLCISNVPWTTSEDDISDYFKSIGANIEGTKMIRDTVAEGSNGYCFILCADMESTNKILRDEHHYIKDKYFRVTKAATEEKKQKSNQKQSKRTSISHSSSRSTSGSRYNKRRKYKSGRKPRKKSKKYKSISSSISRSSSRSKSPKLKKKSRKKLSSDEKPPICLHGKYYNLASSHSDFKPDCSVCHKKQKFYIWQCAICEQMLCKHCKDLLVSQPPPMPDKCTHSQGYYTVGAVDKKTNQLNPKYNGTCEMCHHYQHKATWNCSLCHKRFCKECQQKYITQPTKPENDSPSL